ncbi:hypothetical protein TNCV_1744341 [Trichonephila clavipes]|nr:hypothetical protein TNCV_1744341 [Trichonephila clavipes]
MKKEKRDVPLRTADSQAGRLWQPKPSSLRAQAQLMRTETVETFELVKVEPKLLRKEKGERERQRHFGISSNLKNIIDADSDDENEMNDAAPIPMSSEMRDIMKSLHATGMPSKNESINKGHRMMVVLQCSVENETRPVPRPRPSWSMPQNVPFPHVFEKQFKVNPCLSWNILFTSARYEVLRMRRGLNRGPGPVGPFLKTFLFPTLLKSNSKSTHACLGTFYLLQLVEKCFQKAKFSDIYVESDEEVTSVIEFNDYVTFDKSLSIYETEAEDVVD